MRKAKKRRVFISYSSKSTESVFLSAEIFAGLRTAGIDVFLDRQMVLGTDWVAEIAVQIAQCDFFIVLLAEAVIASEMVWGEVRLAYQRYKEEKIPRILPIRVCFEGPLGYGLDVYLSKFQFRRWENGADTRRVLSEILAAMDLATNEVVLLSERSTPPFESEIDPAPSLPRPAVDPRRFSAPGGTLRRDDPFYLERRVDTIARSRARLTGETVVIKAPRQMGKSSLLIRYLSECRSVGKEIAFLDFSTFAESEFQDYGVMLLELAAFLVRSLGLKVTIPSRVKKQVWFIRFLEKDILSCVPHGLVIALDEVDRLLSREFSGDFFSMLRSWHNSRAESASEWSKVDLALVISTEPYLLIDSVDRSPFNVSPALELGPFDGSQYARLNQFYGSPLSEAETDTLHAFLGGHPYLGRLALYLLANSVYATLDALLTKAIDQEGPFGDHLEALLLKLCRDKVLLAGARSIFDSRGQPDGDVCYRLKGAGLVRRENGIFKPANILYEQFFRRAL